ncbi:MAG: helix-turn-helix domain-containing protein [Lachnospiraceae bacterium]|nr:helix-turn-helix domain-containing protein [Lachnospiraceae bacterium]
MTLAADWAQKSVGFTFDACGFHTMSSFVNAFKTHTGMTPSEYKRNHLTKNSGHR